jgi:2-polyprenyl-3-methyl-5-hydroxy-6-metoxy-1,4-benzoquinol methylase
MTTVSTQLGPRELSQVSKSLYVDGGLLMRKLQHWRPFICPFERLLPFVPDRSRVLDIGCGGGLFLGLLVGSGRDIASGTGFDVSAPAIDAARRMASRVERSRGRAVLRFERLDVAAPWPEGPFDVVCLIDVMHHVPPSAQRAVLEQAAAQVTPGGTLIYKDMCRRPHWRALMNRLHDLVLARQWIHYLPIDHAERSLVATGLRVTHRESANRLWYGHELRVFRKPP